MHEQTTHTVEQGHIVPERRQKSTLENFTSALLIPSRDADQDVRSLAPLLKFRGPHPAELIPQIGICIGI